MKFISKVATAHYVLKNHREFYDVECPLDEDEIARAQEILAQSDIVNDYFSQVYGLLRQGADPSSVEVPECLKEKDEQSLEELGIEPEALDTEATLNGFSADS